MSRSKHVPTNASEIVSRIVRERRVFIQLLGGTGRHFALPSEELVLVQQSSRGIAISRPIYNHPAVDKHEDLKQDGLKKRMPAPLNLKPGHSI